MTDRPSPPDQAASARITTDLDSTLFVEAGAGSGKTSALVDRVLALVTTGAAELRSIAAITFTEKAADELRDRIRRALEEQAEDHPDTADGARAVVVALEQLDGAALGTLHSFARRLLTEHPLEAGLPPRVEVLDEVSSAVAFEQRWSMFLDELLADPTLERTLLLLFATGAGPEALRTLALTFDDNWDLVEEQVPAGAPDPPSVQTLFAFAYAAVRELCAEPCSDPTDLLRLRLDEIADYVEKLAAITEELELASGSRTRPRAQPEAPQLQGGQAGKEHRVRRREQTSSAAPPRPASASRPCRGEVAAACARRVAVAIRSFTLSAAAERRRAGQLQFHDLLVLARALLRSPEYGAAVRAQVHQRYQRLLLDEFQDTDPIQVELAVRIAAAEPGSAPAGTAPWTEVALTPGQLFVVGDPKQSIYRFRRADISTFLTAARHFAGGGEDRVELTANFRTAAPVIEWVNVTFDVLMSRARRRRVSRRLSARLHRSRPDAVGSRRGTAGVRSSGDVRTRRASRPKKLRAAEAAEVAATVARIVHEGWSVDDGAGGWRRAQLGDIAILVPARTSLPFLEDALEQAGIAFRAEASSLVYATRAVRDLLMVLRAIDDPTNHLHVVSALRTPLLACGDDDLFRFRKERRGHFGYLGDQPETRAGRRSGAPRPRVPALPV